MTAIAAMQRLASTPAARYAPPVRKIITEILKLLWKVFKQVFWRWIKPMLGRIVLIGLLVVALVGAAIWMAGC